MFWLQFALVLLCILIGSRRGGIGLGTLGGVGLVVMAFVFGASPTSPPIAVMLMILAVVTAAAALEAAGDSTTSSRSPTSCCARNPSTLPSSPRSSPTSSPSRQGPDTPLTRPYQ